MVDRKHGRPRSIAVAILTHVCGQYVGGIFSGGVHTVVAVETAIDDIGMIEIRRNPGDRRVTVVAEFTALNMRGVLACCSGAVVTRVARSKDVQVVDRDGRVPEVGTVAVLANIRRQNMGWSLASGVRTVVTAETVARDVRVIKYSRNPGECRMAVVALLAGHDMRRMLARGINAVVTGCAGSGDCDVVHECDRAPRGGRVAVDAHSRVGDMVDGHGRCADRAELGVTADTGGRRALERAASVTTVTSYIGVRTVEVESCAEMIECILRMYIDRSQN